MRHGTPPPVPDVTRGDPVAHITKARIGWHVIITWGFLRCGLKADGVVFPWWRLTEAGAHRKAKREVARLLARHRVDIPGKPRRRR